MPRLFKIALVLQIGSGALWTLALAMIEGRGGLGVLYIFVPVFSIQAICLIIGLWNYWRYPDRRRHARWLIALPVVFWFLPGIVKTMAGGHLTTGGLVTLLWIAVAITLCASLAMPRKVAGLFPDFMFRSRVLNSLILAGPVCGWLVLAGILLWLFGVGGDESSGAVRRDSSANSAAYFMVAAAAYLIALGVSSLLCGMWAWLGLRSGIEGACRKLNVTQIVVASPGLLIGVISVLFLLTQN